MPVASLRPHPGNARVHSKKQVRQIADSIRHFGFTNPVLIGEDGGFYIPAPIENAANFFRTFAWGPPSAEERRPIAVGNADRSRVADCITGA